MSTLPPPATKKFPEDSVEAQVYKIVNDFKEYMPVDNDRNRLGFGLYKFVMGEGDHPKILLKTSQIRVEGISEEALADKIAAELAKVKK